MKKKLAILLLAVTSMGTLAGCSNTAAKHFGGTMNLDLPAGQKLINVTWKENDLWTLTRPMTENDIPETYLFEANTNFGILEGKVILKESR